MATVPSAFSRSLAAATLFPMDVYATFLQTIRRYRLIEPGDRVLAAVSGGADSAALLALLKELRDPAFELAVAHLDHGMRGEAGAADAAYVAEAAGAHGLEFFTARLDDAGLRRTGRGPRRSEAWLRRRRFAFLARTAAAWGAGKIALGHTRDDQAETFLLNLIRGAGTQGLGGMPFISPLPGLGSMPATGPAGAPAASSPGRQPRRSGLPRVIRPLLLIPRGDIEAWLAGRGIVPRQDATNADPGYLRNRLRAELLPLLDDLRPGARAAIARAAHLLQEDEALLETLAERALARAPHVVPPDADAGAADYGAGQAEPDDQEQASVRAELRTPAAPGPGADGAARNRTAPLSVESLQARPRPLARRLLRRAAAPQTPGAGQIEAVLELIQDGRGGQIDLGGGLVARVKGGRRGQVTLEPAAG